MEAAAIEEEVLTLDRERARRSAVSELGAKVVTDVSPERKQKLIEEAVADFDDNRLASYADPMPRDGAIWPERLEKSRATRRRWNASSTAHRAAGPRHRASYETNPIRPAAAGAKRPGDCFAPLAMTASGRRREV